MSYKPLAGLDLVSAHRQTNFAAFTAAQQALQGLEFPDYEGVQIKKIVGDGMTIDERGALTIATGANNQAKAIKALSSAPAASAENLPVNFQQYERTFEFGIFVPASLFESKIIFYRMRSEAAANLLEIGKNEYNDFYVKVGDGAEVPHQGISRGSGGSLYPFDCDTDARLMDLGVMLNDQYATFFYGGVSEASQALGTYNLPSPTALTIDLLVSAPGVIMTYFRHLKGYRYPVDGVYTPFGKRDLPLVFSYYDFAESGETCYDLGDDGFNLVLDDGERVIV